MSYSPVRLDLLNDVSACGAQASQERPTAAAEQAGPAPVVPQSTVTLAQQPSLGVSAPESKVVSESKVAASPILPLFESGESYGTVLPIRADGHCLFHIAATILLILDSKQFLERSERAAACVASAATALRARCLELFNEWAASGDRTQELDDRCMAIWGENAETVCSTFTGSSYGSAVDLALLLSTTDVGVVVADRERKEVSDKPLDLFRKKPPSKVVCVLKSAGHWDLGGVVVKKEGKRHLRVLFKVEEWERGAMQQIAKFLESDESKVQCGAGKWKPPSEAGT